MTTFTSGQPLFYPADFDAAVAIGAQIEVWQRGEQIGDGIIKGHTLEAVKIDDDYFLKATCQFIFR